MISFAGWEMPVHYKGVVAEHQAVRQFAGIFDVSHMGRIMVHGPDAERFLNHLSTNQIAGKPEGTATYTVWCHEHGGSVDDVLVYKQKDEQFFVTVNASNRSKDLNHLLSHSQQFNVSIQDRYQEDGILALQGPAAESLMDSFIPDARKLKPMHFFCPSTDLVISRTGYTGAGGFEIYGPYAQIVQWWERLIEKGAQPAGLGARDTLRLEMGFALYGHELSDSIAPNESVSAWTIKWNKEDFLGKAALKKLAESSLRRHAYGIELLDRGIARESFPVFQEGCLIGNVTSGSFSPTLNRAIALILVSHPLKSGDLIEVEIRQQRCCAQVVQIPFIRGLK